MGYPETMLLRELPSTAKEVLLENCFATSVLGGSHYSSTVVQISITTSGSASGSFVFEEKAATVMNALSHMWLNFSVGFDFTYRGELAKMILKSIFTQIEFEEKNNVKL